MLRIEHDLDLALADRVDVLHRGCITHGGPRHGDLDRRRKVLWI
jgi:hypothetical protein